MTGVSNKLKLNIKKPCCASRFWTYGLYKKSIIPSFAKYGNYKARSLRLEKILFGYDIERSDTTRTEWWDAANKRAHEQFVYRNKRKNNAETSTV